MTLIELVVLAVVAALLGAGLGTLAGWLAGWPLMLSAGTGGALALLLGAITLFVAILRTGRLPDDRPPDDA